jgi:1-acyl-sn-glycerol-3-phosphate acyltransferase
MRIGSHPNPDLPYWRMAAGVERPTIFYRIMRAGCRVVFPLFCKARVFGRHNEPAEGGAVFICNHQSYLDPMLIGIGMRRPMSYMARDTLFRIGPFAKLIRAVNAFPVKRGTADTGALKEAMRRIKAGGQVLVFAEGTRTLDGRIGPLLPGVALLAQRTAQWTVPVVIDGAFESWPRTQSLPSPGNIVVQFGRAIGQDEARKRSAQEFIDLVRRQMIEIQTGLRRRAGRPALNYEETSTTFPHEPKENQ